MKKLTILCSFVCLTFVQKVYSQGPLQTNQVNIVLGNLNPNINLLLQDVVLNTSGTQSGTTVENDFPLYGVNIYGGPIYDDYVAYGYIAFPTKPSISTPYVLKVLSSSYVTVHNISNQSATTYVSTDYDGVAPVNGAAVTVNAGQTINIPIPVAAKSYTTWGTEFRLHVIIH